MLQDENASFINTLPTLPNDVIMIRTTRKALATKVTSIYFNA